MKSILRFLPALLLFCPILRASPQEIVNDAVWKDTDAQEIIAQGGSMIRVGQIYYWYGYDISKNDVRLYTSPDLVNWTSRGVVYDGNTWYGRPDVLYNARTARYVMVTEGPRSTGRNAVVFYTSAKATGPFVRQTVTDTVFGKTMGDHSVFKDDNGDAYLVAVIDPTSTNYNGGMTIAKLTPNYLGLESEVATWNNGSDHREAPAIVKKDGFYYLFTSWTNGWKSSATKYQKSATLAGLATATKTPLATSPASGDSFNTQHDFILSVQGSGGASYVYCGDRYSQYTKVGIGKNGWYPLTFDNNGVPLLNGLQRWTIDTATGLWGVKPLEAGTPYRILSQQSGKALSVSSTAGTDGTLVEQRTYAGGLDQRWTFTPFGNNQYLVQTAKDGRALDVTGASTDNGALAQVSNLSGMTSQTWVATQASGGYYKITNLNSAMALNVAGSSTADGARIEQWTFSDWTSQHWTIDIPQATTSFASDGIYKIIDRQSGKALTVAGGGTADGTLLEQRTFTSAASQQWSLQSVGPDEYVIVNVQTGKALSVVSASQANGASIEIRTSSGTPEQIWVASNLTGGYYELTNLNSAKALNVSGSATADGAKIEQWTFGNWNSQYWTITPL